VKGERYGQNSRQFDRIMQFTVKLSVLFKYCKIETQLKAAVEMPDTVVAD